MLTRDLLNYRCRAGNVVPAFVDGTDARSQDMARALLDSWLRACRKHETRGVLEERLEMLLKGNGTPLTAAGMHKVLLDHSVWNSAGASAEAPDFPAWRRRLFLAAAAYRRNCGGDYGQFRAALTADPELRLAPEAEIYPDLPENERLESLELKSAEELIARYNLVLVQSLLLHAQSLVLTVGAKERGVVRRLFKYLKFFRLLARIEEVKPQPRGTAGMTVMRISVEGPLALFGEVRKYGLQLASFFPAVLSVPWWTLEAQLCIGKRQLKFKLNHETGLMGAYRHFGAYIPEEIGMFGQLFAQKSTDWLLEDEGIFFSAPPEVIVPDFTFRRVSDGKEVGLELFHRWHATALPGRLEYLKEHPELPLLLGIDRALLPAGELEPLAANYPELAGRLFAFRDFPGVDRVRKCLSQLPEVRKSAPAKTKIAKMNKKNQKTS